MATQLYARTPRTYFHPIALAWETDLLTVAGTVENPLVLSSTTVNGERIFDGDGNNHALALWSERLVSAVTLSGDVTFQVNAKQNLIGSDPELRVRARLWKVTAGGSDVETLLTEADATASLTGSYALYTFTGTITTPVDCVENERLVLRMYVFPVTGDFNAAAPGAWVRYCDSGGAGANPTGVTLTETVTFKPNGIELFLRTTATIGIDDFLDLSLTRGSSAATTRTIPTIAGGTEIAFTRPAPGSVAVAEITGAVIASTAQATTYVSASFTPVVDRLYLLAVAHADAAAEATVPTVATTTGLTFVRVGSSIPFNSIASNLNRLTLFRAMKPSGLSAGTYTVTFGDAALGCTALLSEVTGVATTGTDGADALQNISTNNADASANPSVTLAAFAQSYHGTFACFGASTETAPTNGSGFTSLSDPSIFAANPVAVTEITAAAIASTTNAATYASASFTPVANRLYLLAVVHSDAAAEATEPTVATTTGLAFVQVGSSLPFDTIASNLHRLTLFRAMKPSGLGAGTYTVTFGDNSTGCAALLSEVTGVLTTGSDGADAIRNVSTNSGDASANPSVTLAAFAQSYHGTFACFGSDIETAPTNGSGFTSLSDPHYATPSTGVYAEWKATNGTTADCVLASSDWAGIAVELCASVATPATGLYAEWKDTSDTSADCVLASSNWAGIAVELIAAVLTLEWIGPRLKAGWRGIPDALGVGAYTYMTESNVLANCSGVIKLFRRQPTGTELLAYTATTGGSGELPTTLSGENPHNIPPWSGGITIFAEDDRMVVRAYIANWGTMAAGYICSLLFDSSVDDGNARIVLYGLPEFKDEGDPVGTSRITDGQSMSGIGN